MRRLTCSLGLLAVTALSIDCGPGPAPLSGTALYTEGCRQVMDPADPHPPCDPQTHNPNGAMGDGDPPLTVSCGIQLGDGGPSRIRLTIAQGGVTSGQGFALCGTVPGEGMEMQNTRVDLYFGGETVHNVTAPGLCHVKINTLTATSFSGQIQCTDVPGPAVPTKLHFVNGIAPIMGQGGTTDPAWGDFSFSQCTQTVVLCQ